MKVIHVHIRNEEGKIDCYETSGSFILAIKTLWAIWQYDGGEIQINPPKEEPPKGL